MGHFKAPRGYAVELASAVQRCHSRRVKIGRHVLLPAEPTEERRPRGGRPTRAAAAERDERLLEIAAAMFMEQGFEATAMDRVAEAAGVGKATLYARYQDKAALFAAVLRRRIMEVYEPLEIEAASTGDDLACGLQRVADGLLGKMFTPGAVALGRILSAQAPNFPDLAEMAVREGYGRQAGIVEAVLRRHGGDPRYRLGDIPLAADMFLALVLGRASRLALLGVTLDREQLAQRTRAAVAFFLRGVAA